MAAPCALLTLHRLAPITGSWQQLLSHPPDLTIVLNGLAGAGWLLWLWLLARTALLLTPTRHVRRPPRRWRLPPPLHALSTSLAGSVALATATSGEPPSTNHPATTPPTRPASTALVAWTPATPRPNDAQPPVYRVARGDWMVAVAQRFLGDQDRYLDIERLNPQWEHRDDRFPDHWEPGWTVVLPADAHDRGPRPHASGQLVNLAAPTPPAQHPPGAEATEPEPAPSAAPSDSPSPSPNAPGSVPAAPDPDGVVPDPSTPPSASSSTAAPSVNATSSPTASDSPSSDPPAPVPNAEDGQGVDLPGGWVALPLAAALVAAAAMVWRRRRHRCVSRPVHGEPSQDPDLPPLPPVVNRLRHAVREQAPDLLDPPPAPRQPTVAEYADADTDTDELDLPPVGPSGVDLAGLTEQIPADGLGLTGPGAEPAARALLVATLSTGSPTDPDARGQVVIPADALTTLLGGPVEIGAIPRLTITATLSEALMRVEELLIERRRQMQEHDAADLAALRAADAYHPPMPPVLLLTEAPPPQLHARLTTTLRLGVPVQISAVLLGAWPAGDTVTVHADGRTTAAGGQRLAVLDGPTTVQLLHVLREAHTGEPAPPPAQPEPDLGSQPSGEPTTTEPQPAPPAGDTAVDLIATDPADPGDADPPPAASRRRPVGIQLLGEPTIYHRDGTAVTGLRRHARQLLVYLAVHRDGADLDHIMEAFWPTATMRRASERLSTEVSNLRGRIRQAAGENKIEPVINTGSRYVLNTDVVDIDLWRMIDALRRAGTATDPTTRITALRGAIDIHTGGLADGHDYDWIEQPREHVRRHGVRARLYLADLLAEDDPSQAATLAQAAADLDAYNEDAARRAMRTLARIGDAAGIRTRLQRLRDALAEIDQQPSNDTIALAAQLQTSAKADP